MRIAFLPRALVTLATAGLLSGCGGIGCCLTVDREGVGGAHHILILGIGVVSLPVPSRSAVSAARVEAVGLTASTIPGLGVSLGYLSAQSVGVDEGAGDVTVIVERGASGALSVETRATRLANGERR